jgi:polysaccharide pyruvyl transferase WcaK-like protein
MRDQASKALAEKLTDGERKIGLLGDFAQGLALPASVVGGRIGLALNVSSVAGTTAHYVHLVGTLLLHVDRVVLFTTGVYSDLVQARRIQASLPNGHIDIFHPNKLSELLGFVASAKVTIATRLHAAILAVSSGVNCIGLCFSGKLKNYFQSNGQPQACLSLREMMSILDIEGYNGLLIKATSTFANDQVEQERQRISELLGRP